MIKIDDRNTLRLGVRNEAVRDKMTLSARMVWGATKSPTPKSPTTKVQQRKVQLRKVQLQKVQLQKVQLQKVQLLKDLQKTKKPY